MRQARSGFTTGACAAAAARAATLALVRGGPMGEVTTLLPDGQQVVLAVQVTLVDKNSAVAVVVKDGGSGPDVTHGAHITAQVTLSAGPGNILLTGGEGVGRVTKPGLPVAVGEAAINPIPRRNIIENVQTAGAELLTRHGLHVIISVPHGELMARRTLNPRLGIMGGISILGVSGIAHPYSTAAFKATVIQGIQAAAQQGAAAVVLTTGGRAERFAMNTLPKLAGVGFVQMGDYVGVALDAVAAHPLPRVIVAGMPGKLVKIAEGRRDTHARRGPFNPDFLVALARAIGAADAPALAHANTIAHAVEMLAAEGLDHPFRALLVETARQAMASRLPKGRMVGVLAFDFDGQLTAHAGGEAWSPFAG